MKNLTTIKFLVYMFFLLLCFFVNPNLSPLVEAARHFRPEHRTLHKFHPRASSVLLKCTPRSMNTIRRPLKGPTKGNKEIPR